MVATLRNTIRLKDKALAKSAANAKDVVEEEAAIESNAAEGSKAIEESVGPPLTFLDQKKKEFKEGLTPLIIKYIKNHKSYSPDYTNTIYKSAL